MNIQKLTVSQVNALEVQTVVKEEKPRVQAHFFVPDGYGLNSKLRAVGSHLPADHPDLAKGALILSDSLLATQGMSTAQGNTLISPATLSDSELRKYGERLRDAATMNPDDTPLTMQSPAIVPYLLGGIPLTGVEKLVTRMLGVMEMFPEDEDGTFAASTKAVGFAPGQSHFHTDWRGAQTDNNLSHRQDYLVNEVRFGNWVDTLLMAGAYNGTMRKRMTGIKAGAVAWVQTLLDPRTGEMTEFAAQHRRSVQVTDRDFAMAVLRAYERPWSELDLTGGFTIAEVTRDTEVLLARYIIAKQATTIKMSAQTLAGISLLTGISMAKFTEFAVYDQARRGETFITGEAIDQALDLLGMSGEARCERAVRDHAISLRYSDGPDRLRAKRLRSLKKPLWSSNGAFYKLNNRGFFKHKMESFNK